MREESRNLVSIREIYYQEKYLLCPLCVGMLNLGYFLSPRREPGSPTDLCRRR